MARLGLHHTSNLSCFNLTNALEAVYSVVTAHKYEVAFSLLSIL